MRLRSLGPTGVQVAAIGLGGMPLSIAGRPDEAAALAVLRAAFEAGVTLVDTADVYCLDNSDLGHNERLIAAALRSWPRRDEIFVATKGGLRRPRGAWTLAARPDQLRAACEASLTALGVSSIFLYQLHAVDPDVPFADSVGALAELRTAGLIQHIGLSNVSAAQIREALDIAPVVSVQNRCHPLDRRAFHDGVLKTCETHGLAFLPYSPVGGGRERQKLAQDPVLNEVGRRHGATPQQVALAWLLDQSPAMLPIPGASRPRSILDSVAAASLTLTAADRAQLGWAFPTA